MMNKSDAGIKVNVPALTKFLNQGSLFSVGSEDTIELSVTGSELSLKDKNIDCKLPLEKPSTAEYTLSFKTASLKPVLSNLDTDDIYIAPMMQSTESGEIAVGICCWTDNMEVVIGSVES